MSKWEKKRRRKKAEVHSDLRDNALLRKVGIIMPLFFLCFIVFLFFGVEVLGYLIFAFSMIGIVFLLPISILPGVGGKLKPKERNLGQNLREKRKKCLRINLGRKSNLKR